MSLKLATLLALALMTVVAIVPSARAEKPGFVFPGGCCYYNGQVVRTVVPPSAFPNAGIDSFYGFPGGLAGQKGVVGVAPGTAKYHGGHWAFNAVTWNAGATPSVLTSEAAILAAQTSGAVTIARVPAMDFLCPIQF